VTDEAAVRVFVDEVLAKHGSLEVLVNSVGGYAGGVNLWETDAKLFNQMFALNMRSGYILARATVPAMLKQGHGAIVNIASKAALDHAAGAAAYAASKAAVVANDGFAGGGVKRHRCAGELDSSQYHRHRNKPESNAKADFAKWPKPVDIAGVILFLCSDEAKLIHGAAVPVYGDT